MLRDADVNSIWAVVVAVSQIVFFVGYAVINWKTVGWPKVVAVAAAVVGVALFLALIS